MKIGYARVSTQDQLLDLQIEALKKEGCEKIFHDIISGGVFVRPGLNQAKEMLRKEDVLVVWRLDRLGRSMKDLVEIVTELEKSKIHFKSITENIDTTTTSGKLVFHIFASLAEFEKNLISERTKAGLKAARKRGKIGGRPKKSLELAIKMHKDNFSLKEICKACSISKSTLYRSLKTHQKKKF